MNKNPEGEPNNPEVSSGSDGMTFLDFVKNHQPGKPLRNDMGSFSANLRDFMQRQELTPEKLAKILRVAPETIIKLRELDRIYPSENPGKP